MAPNNHGSKQPDFSPIATIVAMGILSGMVATVARGTPPGPSLASSRVSTQAQATFRLTDQWAVPAERQSMYHPTGLAIASDGRIFVAETGNHIVSVWGFSGRQMNVFRGSADAGGRLRSPEAVAIDEDAGRLFVADTGNRRVVVLALDTGTELAIVTDVGSPRGLAVDDDGRLYVSDGQAHAVHVFDTDGARLARWGATAGASSADDGFSSPRGLAFAGGLLWVADHDNLRLVARRIDGTVERVVDVSGTTSPGGAPLSVAATGNQLYVAVKRGVLRLRLDGTYQTTIPALEEWVPPGCESCKLCLEYRPILAAHEGVRAVAARDGLGVAFSFAPVTRGGDRIVLYPERGFESVFPWWECSSKSPRHLYDPTRIAAGETPELAHVIDVTGRALVLDGDGRWHDFIRGRNMGGAIDIAADGAVPYHIAVLKGPRVSADSLRCFLGCRAEEFEALDARMRQVRDLVGEFVPDYRWWPRALAFHDAIAVLDAGRARLILRDGFPCNTDRSLSCTDRACNSRQQCNFDPIERALLGAVELGSAREPFSAWADVDYDPSGTVWALARTGVVRGVSRGGQRLDAVRLAGHQAADWKTGIAAGAEALAVDMSGYYTLGTDERIRKHDRTGQLLATHDPQADVGPGRFVDIAVAPDGRLLVVDRAGDRILVYEVTSEAPQSPPPVESPCRLIVDKVASPAAVQLGEAVTVTLTTRPVCVGGERDIVLAVDQSCQMSGERLGAARAAAVTLAEQLAPDQRLGIVGFDDEGGGARVLAPLGGPREALAEAAASIASRCRPFQLFPERRNDGRIADGLRAAGELLRGPGGRYGAKKSLIIISASNQDRERLEAADGRRLEGQRLPEVGDRPQALFEARELWAAAVEIYAFGLGMPAQPLGSPPLPTPDLQSSQPPDEGLMAALVSPPDGYQLADPPTRLPELMRGLTSRFSARVALDELSISDLLPDDMVLLDGHTVPPATVRGSSLHWHLGPLDANRPLTLSLRVQPAQEGLRPTNLRARAHYTASNGATGMDLFPVPIVEVMAPEPPPQPTVTATPTVEAEPSPLATSPQPSPTDAPTVAVVTSDVPRTPMDLYLPAVLQHRCKPLGVPLDVVLLIDTSSSMAGAKIDAARGAAGTFLTLLDLPRDRAAIVAFDHTGWVAQPLTGDEEALRAGLATLNTAGGTRIDLGLLSVQDLFVQQTRPLADKVLVLLTDGQPDDGTAEAGIVAAQDLREAGVALWAIGLGREVEVGLLDKLTGDPTMVRTAPTAGDLVDVYSSIARIIPCR